ncbi:hypothetical protein TGME49_308980 [Toxoplasma gondii ME49]|uniref:Uncharacterized protein n=2 Tax=Toxoplasma gondii TaxID=5811 RepID=A0A125YI93_TOXGV|nr:hypothetical protein TGME49_308980 [Toxoplasma gondii ME49]EPT26322.1 hypothetical protein TGME49_308980 [Toxoplasma gondii ME49]ESS34720.1 hypothetical protein TGVEG_308980 [Toxoplasma gondii VEG]CEL77220.1 TPA: hypothetical protein BN1205_093110 [Toxoplasma gondii VEG]|eukprot:XP_002364167.1 hypothetical protein TGME49_308980 [Toxoplasma gondii ME49]
MPLKTSTLSKVATARQPGFLFRKVSPGLRTFTTFRHGRRLQEGDADSQPRELFRMFENEETSDAAREQETADASCTYTRSLDRLREEDPCSVTQEDPDTLFSLREPPCFFRRPARWQDYKPGLGLRNGPEGLRFPVNHSSSAASTGGIGEQQPAAKGAFVGVCEKRQATQKRHDAAAAAAFLVRSLLMRNSPNGISSSTQSPPRSSLSHGLPASLVDSSSLSLSPLWSRGVSADRRREHGEQANEDPVSAVSASKGSRGGNPKTVFGSNRPRSSASRETPLHACHERGAQRPDEDGVCWERSEDVSTPSPSFVEAEGTGGSHLCEDASPSTRKAPSVSERAEGRGGTTEVSLPRFRSGASKGRRTRGNPLEYPFHDNTFPRSSREDRANRFSGDETLEQRQKEAVGDATVEERHERTDRRPSGFSARPQTPPFGDPLPPDKRVERAVAQGHLRLLNVALTEALARASCPQELFRLVVRFREFLLPANAVTALHALAKMKEEGRGNGWIEITRDRKEAPERSQGIILHPCVRMLLGHLVGSRKPRVERASSETERGRTRHEKSEFTQSQNVAQPRAEFSRSMRFGDLATQEAFERTDDAPERGETNPTPRLCKLSSRHLPVALWSVAKLLRPAKNGTKLATPRAKDSGTLSRSCQFEAAKGAASEQARAEKSIGPSALHASSQTAKSCNQNTESSSESRRDRANFYAHEMNEQQDLLHIFLCDSLEAVEQRAAELTPQGINMVSWALSVFCEDKALRMLPRNQDCPMNSHFHAALSAVGQRLLFLLENRASASDERSSATGAVGFESSAEPQEVTAQKLAEDSSGQTSENEKRRLLSVYRESGVDNSSGPAGSSHLLATRKCCRTLATPTSAEVNSSEKLPHAFRTLKTSGDHGGLEGEKSREQFVGPREVCTYLRACSKAGMNDWHVVLAILSLAFQSSEDAYLANVPATSSPHGRLATLCASLPSTQLSYSPELSFASLSKTALSPVCTPRRSSSSSFACGLNFLSQCTTQDILSIIQALQTLFRPFQALLSQHLSPGEHHPGFLSSVTSPEARLIVFATYDLPLAIIRRVEQVFPQLSLETRNQLYVCLVRLANDRCTWKARAQHVKRPCDAEEPMEDYRIETEVEARRTGHGHAFEGKRESLPKPAHASSLFNRDTADVVVVAVRELLGRMQHTEEMTVIRDPATSRTGLRGVA